MCVCIYVLSNNSAICKWHLNKTAKEKISLSSACLVCLFKNRIVNEWMSKWVSEWVSEWTNLYLVLVGERMHMHWNMQMLLHILHAHIFRLTDSQYDESMNIYIYILIFIFFRNKSNLLSLLFNSLTIFFLFLQIYCLKFYTESGIDL